MITGRLDKHPPRSRAPATLRGSPLVMLAALSAAVALSCESGGGRRTDQGPKGLQVLETPVLEVTPPGPVVEVTVGAGTEQLLPLRLSNTGTSDLLIHDLAITEEGAGEAGPAFRVARVQAACNAEDGCTAWTWEPGDGPLPALSIRSPSQGATSGADYALVSVACAGLEDLAPHTGTLRIGTNSIDEAEHAIVIVSRPGVPVGDVSPVELRWDPVAQGASGTLLAQITSVGSAALRIKGLELFGAGDFRVQLGEDSLTPGQSLAPPELTLLPGETLALPVTYAPTSLETAEGALIVHTNEPDLPEGHEVRLVGSAVAPCLASSPPAVLFGKRPVGVEATRPVSLESCGSGEVTLTSLALTPDSSPAFSVTTGDGAGLPLTLPVNGSLPLVVRYTPLVVAPLTRDGETVHDVATLVVESDSLAGPVQVPISGEGAPADCPIAVAEVDGDTLVLPQTAVQLRGDDSWAPSGSIGAWQWVVEQQPEGAAVVPSPAATVANPIVTLDVVGTYRFRLSVWNHEGTPGCWAAPVEVEVVPEKGLHIELVWSTPSDADPSDVGKGAGTDLDLHLVHPLGYAFGEDATGDGLGDGWFEFPYDCYWANALPDWGSPHELAHDDPSLDRDDADGAGPEIVTLPTPQGSALYRVGVHVYDDWGYGPSEATVRIRMDGTLRWEGSATLGADDLWDAALVDWSHRTVLPITDGAGNQVITPAYPVPEGVVPE